MISMMSGEVGFDDLAYKERELIQASMDPSRQTNATNFTLPGAVPIPNLFEPIKKKTCNEISQFQSIMKKSK